MDVALLLFVGGAVVIIWIYFWSQLQKDQPAETEAEQLLTDMNMPITTTQDAVLVSRDPGQLIYVNPVAREMLGMNGGEPNLEYVARIAQPADSFLQLFAGERQAAFQLGARWVEASSHRIPTGQEVRTVVILRELSGAAANADTLDLSRAIRVINHIGETVNANSGIEQTLLTILGIVKQALPFSAGEINLKDEHSGMYEQRGWLGDMNYPVMLAEHGGGYRLDEGITGWIARHRQPMLSSTGSSNVRVLPKVPDNPYQTVMGVPLIHNDQLLGTFEVGSYEAEAFTPGDFALLQAIANSVSVAIYNAMLYAEQARRIEDITTLQQTIQQDVITGESAVREIFAALTARVAQLAGSSLAGIFIYNEARRGLVPALPFHGIQDIIMQPVFIPLPEDSPQRDIWERQPFWISNDVADEALTEALGLSNIVSLVGIQNTAWLPLQIGARRIGALTVSNKRSGSFTSQDFPRLKTLASQAAIVVENVLLAQREQTLDAQLAGLQQITAAIGALTEEDAFFDELTRRIAALMDIEMCGILLYDEDRRQLVSRLPFYGVADEYVRDYVINLTPATVMEELWSDEQTWFSNRVLTDPLTFAAGLDTIASALNVQKTLMAVLSSGGRKLGVVQVSNKRSGQDFNENDARLLLIFATQAATLIENSRLFTEVQTRSEQAQQLRQIAETAGTIATSDEGMRDLLAEIAQIMHSPLAFVNILNQSGGLVTNPRWVYGLELSEPIIQNTEAPEFEYSVVRSRRPFITNDIDADPRILPGYRVVANQFGLKSGMIVPLTLGERVLGELGIANRPTPYSDDDLKTLDSIAAQISAALDRLLVYQERGENLNRRIHELDSIARISSDLTQTLDFDQILNTIRKEAFNATGAIGTTVALLLPSAQWKDPTQPEIERRLGNASVMTTLADIEVAAATRGVTSVSVGNYAGHELKASPPEARSAVAAAIFYLDQVVGVLHLYHDDPHHFDEQAAAFVVTLAAKATLGYGNAQRFREQLERGEGLRRRVEQLNRIFELSQMLPSDTDPVMMLEAVAYSVQQAVGYDTVLILMIDETDGRLRRVAQAGIPIDEFDRSRSLSMSLSTLEDMFRKEEYRYAHSESYLFPAEASMEWYNDEVRVLSAAYESRRPIELSGRNAWRDGDMLLVPIRGATGKLMGVISLDRPHDNRRPDRTAVEVLEIFAHQASNTLENARLFRESVRRSEQETRLNEFMEQVSSSLDIAKIVESVAKGMSSLLSYSRLTLAILDDERHHLEVTQAVIAPNGSITTTQERLLNMATSALGQAYLNRSDMIYRASDEVRSRYDDVREWQANGEKISIVVPLVTAGECLGALHIGSDRPDTSRFAENMTLIKRMAQLISASIENARLYNQSLTLQILNESVVEAIQQGIVVLNNSGHILTINQFMRSKYGWEDKAVGEDLFEYRPELTQLIGREVRIALDKGIPQERTNQITLESGNRQIVRNFYLYPLRGEGENNNVIRGAVLLVEDVTERARLEEQMEERANQLAALTEVASRITASLERNEVVTLALEDMNVLIRYDTMTLWRRNGSYMVLEGFAGTNTIDPNIETRIRINDFERVRQMVDLQRVLVLNFDQPPADILPGERDFRSWMGVPLVNQGHVVGMFVLTNADGYVYESLSDQNIAFAFASQVAIALANADLFEQTFERTNELGTLLEAAQATSITNDLNEILRTVTELMLSSLEMDQCTIMIWDEVDNNLSVEIDINRMGNNDLVQPKGTQYRLVPGSAKLYALREREVVLVQHDDADSPYPEELCDLRNAQYAARMLIPLVAREGSIGLIQLEQHSMDGRSVTQQKLRLARALGSQVATAIQNARLSAEMATMFNEALVINDLSRAISSKLNVADMLTIVRDQIPNITQSDEIYLALYDPASSMISFPLAVRGGTPYTIPPRPLGTDEVSFIIRNGRNLSLGADYFSPDELRRSLGITNGEGDIRSYLGIPLKSGDKVLGALALRDTQRTRAFTINDQRILETVGAQLGAAIENANLFERINTLNENLNQIVVERTRELEEERDRLDTLFQITSELSRTLDMERLQSQSISMVAKAVGAEDAVIFGLDPLTDALFTQAYLNPNNVYLNDEGEKVHQAQGLAQWLLQNQEELWVVIPDLHEFEPWDISAPGAIPWRSALGVVLESSQNDPQGVMCLLSTEVGAFSESEMRLVVAAANQVASSINNADLYHLIRDQAERLGTLLRTEQEEAEKNSAILEAIADGVILSDSDGKVILFNSAAERILALPREQVLGQPLSKFTGLYGREVATWAQTIQDRSAQALDYPDEFVDQRLNFGDKIVSAHLSPVYASGDKLLGMVSVFRDITRDVEVDRMKSEFVASVSHELRTPLTPIKGYTDLLLMGAMGGLNEHQAHMLTKIKENVERLAILVEDVLDISKIDSGREKLKVEPVEIEQIIDTVLNNLRERPQHARKVLAISVHVEPEANHISADRDKFTRIMSNIVDNAYNYTASGGSIEIRAKLQPDQRFVLISVTDSGVGIPEQYRDDIWKRFTRIEEHALSMEVAGTGLGLAIVKEMVEMHGGDVWFESEVNQGTTFYISMPVEPPDFLRTSTGTFRQVRTE